MIETFRSGGVMMWPMLVVALGVLFLAGRVARALFASDAPRVAVEPGLQSILFWGGTGAVLGLLGTVIGLVQAANAVKLAGGASAATIWSGVGVALVTSVFGLLILLAALLLWFGLSRRIA